MWVWLFYFLCGNSRPVSKSRLCCNSLQDFAHIFCCAGNGIAAEHIVAIVFVVNENCPHVFAAQEKELLLNKSRLCCNSLQDFAHIFCRAGNGIAAEHIVAIVFVVNENCPRVFDAQEKELLLNNTQSLLLGWIIFTMIAFSQLRHK